MSFAATNDNVHVMTTNRPEMRDRWAVFDECRPRLSGIALRMLGSVDDAEDMVQETSLRWLQTDLAAVRAPEGWLIAVVTRLSIDRLRRVTERPLPSPETQESRPMAIEVAGPERQIELRSELSCALLALREQLEPAARTALVLRDAFSCDYGEIARALEKSVPACRQIVHRARARIRQSASCLGPRGRFRWESAERFLLALSTSDRETALAVLNEDVGARSVG